MKEKSWDAWAEVYVPSSVRSAGATGVSQDNIERQRRRLAVKNEGSHGDLGSNVEVLNEDSNHQVPALPDGSVVLEAVRREGVLERILRDLRESGEEEEDMTARPRQAMAR